MFHVKQHSINSKNVSRETFLKKWNTINNIPSNRLFVNVKKQTHLIGEDEGLPPERGYFFGVEETLSILIKARP